MANTTNYNWETPDDTDLVKDGAAAIRTLGNSIDTTTKNLNPETTTGDIAYRSATANTNTRLAIGSAGQVLTVAAGVPSWATPNVGDITEVQAGVGISVASGTGPIPVITNSSTDLITTAGDLLYGTAADTVARLGIGTAGQVLKVNSGATAPEWGAAGGTSGLTLITSGTFTTSSAINVSDCFSATYKDYKILVKITASSTPQAIDMRMRVSGANNTDSNHDTSELKQVSTTVSGAQFVDVNRFQEIASAYTGNYVGLIDILMINPYATDYTGGYANSNTFSSGDRLQKMVSFAKEATTSFTGFGLIPSVGTISGSYKVYGLAD